jgi:hypothetical protein
MELQSSLLCPQDSATDPYRQQDESSPHTYNLFLLIPILISSHLRYASSGLFPSDFPAKILYASLISPLL